MRNIALLKTYLAMVRSNESDDALSDGRLSRSGFSNQTQGFAFQKVETHIGDGTNRFAPAISGRKHFGQ
nr:hypothetical protein SHINE37_100214 [Rhizobiaceae bacterium]